MKRNSSSPRSQTRKLHLKKHGSQGMALVIVLSLLMLITVLVVAFYQIVTRERDESLSFSTRITAQQLADSAVDLVIAQIREATSGFEKDNNGNPLYSRPLAWASQPGAIRTYRQDGVPHLIFKLYSARRLVTTNPNELTTGQSNSDVPTDWASRPALYTDLNAPVTNREGVTLYPIADPQRDASGNFAPFTEGFSYSGAPTSGTTNPLPMPAQWLYILRDGTITSPTVATSTGNTAVWSGAGAFSPSMNNPIIGRIAFWTDDETCKVNINTASDGTYWDSPRANFSNEHNLANYQPANREYQTFPGHPATTSLVPIFFFNGTATPILPLFQHNALLKLVPRIEPGGSHRVTSIASAPITLDNQRFYASVDELIYANTSSGARAQQDINAAITRERIDAARFFLTAHSRAPETTLFNSPRVAIWPIDANPNQRTALDNLVAFCSTIGGRPFYFQRSDPNSVNADFLNIPRNQQLFAYLRRLTSNTFPGFGTNYCLVPDVTNSTTASNKKAAPRYGSFLQKYGAQNLDYILTQIFDYIRITNTDDVQHTQPANNATGSRNLARYGNRSLLSTALPIEGPTVPPERLLGMGQVLPIHIGPPHTSVATRGHGRFPTVTEAGLHFICNADHANATSNTLANVMLGGTLLSPNQRRIEAMFYIETFTAAHGYPWFMPSVVIEVEGLNNFRINGQPLGFPASTSSNPAYTITRHPALWIPDLRPMGGFSSHRLFFKDALTYGRGAVPADSGVSVWSQYPFVSFPITVDASSGVMNFTGERITIRIFRRSSANWPFYNRLTDLVQTIEMEIPGGVFPIPQLVTTSTPSFIPGTPPRSAPPTQPQNWWAFRRDGALPGFRGRLEFAHEIPAGGGCGNIFRQGDVARSVVPVHGDYRILSCMHTVPASMFVKHPDYDNPTVAFAHNLSEGLGANAHNYLTGFKTNPNALVPTSGYGTATGSLAWPDVPIPNTNSQFGDWDTQVGYAADGPFINKPDEGNQFRVGAGQIPYFNRDESYVIPDNTFFSAIRQVPSAFMFGSLSTGIATNTPYQTLLFRPEQRIIGGSMHFGLCVPRDHLIADLFWMPVVEPYAISEPFSTAGKINMNYRIAPYDYLRRATGLHAVLYSERLAAIHVNHAPNYKVYGIPNAINSSMRLPIDREATLRQFEEHFNRGNIFRSDTEIADLQIVPQGQSLNSVEDPNGFWWQHRITGENLREKIYATLLPRLTTKSNTYTVHFRVQVLQQRNHPNSSDYQTWDETQDQILSEYRGSATIERYIDPNQPGLPDFAQMDPANASTMANYNIDRFYRFRTINIRRFAP